MTISFFFAKWPSLISRLACRRQLVNNRPSFPFLSDYVRRSPVRCSETRTAPRGWLPKRKRKRKEYWFATKGRDEISWQGGKTKERADKAKAKRGTESSAKQVPISLEGLAAVLVVLPVYVVRLYAYASYKCTLHFVFSTARGVSCPFCTPCPTLIFQC